MLVREGQVLLPSHASGGFDHVDVHLPTGWVFVAHTANGTVEVIDGEQLIHRATLAGCQEASGVLCPPKRGNHLRRLQGAGKILVINPMMFKLKHESMVGTRPNGLAFDAKRKRLLVADVQDEAVRLIEPKNGRIVATAKLPGRPRWCACDRHSDRFLANIKEPAGLASLRAESLEQSGILKIPEHGLHGLDIDTEARLAFVACDGGSVVVVNLETAKVKGKILISGEPDVIWFNTQRHLLYCAIGKPGIIQVIDPKSSTIIQELPTEEGAHTFAFDQLRQRLYVLLSAQLQGLRLQRNKVNW